MTVYELVVWLQKFSPEDEVFIRAFSEYETELGVMHDGCEEAVDVNSV